jgi:hypothetical protein
MQELLKSARRTAERTAAVTLIVTVLVAGVTGYCLCEVLFGGWPQ